MKTQIIITEITDGYQWLVIKHGEIVGQGFDADSFQAFKQARAVYDRN